MIRLIMPVFLFIFGLAFFIASLNLPTAQLGVTYGPIYFPALICALLTIFSLIYFFQEWKQRDQELEEVKRLFQGRTPKLIISTIILIAIYSFLFERIGFLFSTMIFLGGLLFSVNGKKRWLQNITISVIFSFIAWYGFAELLKVSLP